MADLQLWTPHELFMLQQDDRLQPIPSYFLDTYFTETYFSDDKEILIGKLPIPYRRLAPFVLPTEQGKPIYSRRGETVKALTPAYIKPKDAVRPEEARNVLPSEVFRNGGQRPSLQQRFDSRVVDVTQFHLRAIKMQWAWMAARAFIDGKVVINYERDAGAAYPQVTVDFGRDSGQTITKSSGTYWSDPDYDIINDLTSWSNIMYAAQFGGHPAQIIVGTSVVPYLQRNKGILSLLSTQIRGGEGTSMERGIMSVNRELTKFMTISTLGQASIDIYSYKDQVENNDGSMVDILDPRDVLLIAPGATGVKAFGAIYDVEAMQGNSLPIDIFPKMWAEKDPGELYVMHQSAPLMIPLYPNRTLKARVLA
jgi:hypothetical protein